MNIWEFPFSSQAAEHVRAADYSLDSLLNKRGFLPVRKRAAERVRGAVEGEIPGEYSHGEVELLSYPLARVMVSCLGDEYLFRRYALAESKLAHRRMQKSREDLPVLARDLGIGPVAQGDLFRLHFTEYLPAASRMHSPRWKLVNRALRGGHLTVTSEELIRLLEEMVRERVLNGLPLAVEEKICQELSLYLDPIRLELEEAKNRNRVDLGPVEEGAFPPCIRAMLAQVAAGVNLAHTARFALTSFLLRIGMDVDQVVGIFNTSPDFDEE
ncbi:MAG: DNA primase large subunit PriL, partial [Methanosarcinales archaeon]|nr:DNA primase large subunit PriL [Methanosarcinales archaeon]